MTRSPLHKLLVTTDNSALGNHALAHAQALATALGAQLVVLSVLPDLVIPMVEGYAYLPETSPEEMLEEQRHVQADLSARVPGAEIVLTRAAGRAVPHIITEVARDIACQMIVMSTHGRSGLGRALLGSVAEAVAHTSPVPVVLVKAEHAVTAWADPLP